MSVLWECCFTICNSVFPLCLLLCQSSSYVCGFCVCVWCAVQQFLSDLTCVWVFNAQLLGVCVRGTYNWINWKGQIPHRQLLDCFCPPLRSILHTSTVQTFSCGSLFEKVCELCVTVFGVKRLVWRGYMLVRVHYLLTVLHSTTHSRLKCYCFSFCTFKWNYSEMYLAQG